MFLNMLSVFIPGRTITPLAPFFASGRKKIYFIWAYGRKKYMCLVRKTKSKLNSLSKSFCTKIRQNGCFHWHNFFIGQSQAAFQYTLITAPNTNMSAKHKSASVSAAAGDKTLLNIWQKQPKNDSNESATSTRLIEIKT